MHLIYLSAQEENILEGHIKKSSLETVRLRAHAIAMRAQRIGVKDISKLVYRSESTVTRWLKDFIERRISSLFSGNVNNENAAKLIRDHKKEVKWLLSQPPDEYGIPERFWNVPKLKNYLKVVFDVVYDSDSSYHLLLKFSGLSLKYPDVVSPRRDEEAIKKRIKEIRKEIKPLLIDDDWIVFASDETRLQKEAEIRRAWFVKGKRTVVKTERSKEHQNYLGFLNQKTFKNLVFEIDRGNTEETIRVLRELVKLYPNKRICIVWDNASWHKTKKLRDELKKGESLEKIHLIALQPYAPETNPIEHVWGYAKQQLANKAGRDFDKIKQEFLSFTNKQIFAYHI